MPTLSRTIQMTRSKSGLASHMLAPSRQSTMRFMRGQNLKVRNSDEQQESGKPVHGNIEWVCQGAGMKNRSGAWAVVTGVSLSLGFAFPAYTRNRSPRLPSPGTLGAPFLPQDPSTPQKGAVVTAHANGTFEVKVVPQSPEDKTEGATVGGWTIVKLYLRAL